MNVQGFGSDHDPSDTFLVLAIMDRGNQR